MTVVGVVVDDPGSGYAAAPKVVIRDGPVFAPVNTARAAAAAAVREKIKGKKVGQLAGAQAAAVRPAAVTPASATATIKILSVTVNTFGAGYTACPRRRHH